MGFPSCIPVFSYVSRYRFVLAVLHVDGGSYWSTMVSDELDRHCWSAGTSCARVSGRGLLLQDSPTSPQALRWTISIFYHQQHVFWLGVHGQVGVHGLSGLDFPVRGISLRRSVHDAGFV